MDGRADKMTTSITQFDRYLYIDTIPLREGSIELNEE